MRRAKELFIVDGYNVLNAWHMVSSSINLEAARDDLVQVLADFAGYRAMEILLVFDAHMSGRYGSEDQVANVKIIYTKKHETADSRIERIIKKMVNSYNCVTVVTADYTLQLFVLTEGALRMTPNELKMRMTFAREEGLGG